MGNEISNKKDYLSILKLIKDNTKDEKEAFQFLIRIAGYNDIDNLYDIINSNDLIKMFSFIPNNLIYIASSAIKLLHEISVKNNLSSESGSHVRRIAKILNLILTRIIPLKELSFLFLENNYIEIEKYEIEYLKEKITKESNSFTNEQHPSNLVVIVSTILNLLFKPHICVPGSIPEIQLTVIDPNPYLIWHSGVLLATSNQDKITTYNSTRIELIKMLLILSSSSVYFPIEEFSKIPNVALMMLTNKYTPNGQNLFYSLLNTVLTYNWKGLGIPFLHTLTSSNYEEELTLLSIELLLALIDFKPIEFVTTSKAVKESISFLQKNSEKIDPSIKILDSLKNQEIKCLIANINSKQDFDILFEGALRLMENIVSSSVASIPNSYKQLDFTDAIVFLFFRIALINPLFCNDLMIRKDPKIIILALLITMNKNYLKKDGINIFYISTYFLFKLSQIEEFGNIVSTIPFTEGINFMIPAFTGSYTDLIIMLSYKIITNNDSKLFNAQIALFFILRNLFYYLDLMELKILLFRLLFLF